MANPKDILVITSSTVEGLNIKQYIKPVSAHIVAGTNLFSDFLGGITDVFGGRSQTYQKQLTSLYNEAIERIKFAAFEIGANCIVGLNIDMDEISGKGKSMFMLTAIGTAVIIEKEDKIKKAELKSIDKLQNVGVDRINILRKKKAIIDKAQAGTLNLNEDIWNFITANGVSEIFPYLLTKFSAAIKYEHSNSGASENFYRLLLNFIEVLPEEQKQDLLYDSIKQEQTEQVYLKLSEIIKELYLFDIERTLDLLKSENFKTKKIGLRISTYDKSYYNKQEQEDLKKLHNYIKENFQERGSRSIKKQLLSSKEKEVWTCDCGKTNDIETYCNGCSTDIFGFKEDEIKPQVVTDYIQQKIDLISECIE